MVMKNSVFYAVLIAVPGKGRNMRKKSTVHKKIMEMADRIVVRFNPEKIILFGFSCTGRRGTGQRRGFAY